MAVAYNQKKTVEKKSQSHPHANYVAVFIALAVLTAIEVTITQLPLPKAPLLIPLSLIKAALVALFYMHLRHDRRIFAAFFVFGGVVGMAFVISLVVLLNTTYGGYHLH